MSLSCYCDSFVLQAKTLGGGKSATLRATSNDACSSVPLSFVTVILLFELNLPNIGHG